MAFIHQINLSNENPPIRAYIHNTWKEKLNNENIKSIQNYLLTLTRMIIPKPDFKPDFTLATLWKDEDFKGEKINKIDVYRFQNLNPWPGNPVINSFQIENSHLIKKPLIDFLEEGSRIFDREEAYRRTCRNLSEYANNPPRFPLS